MSDMALHVADKPLESERHSPSVVDLSRADNSEYATGRSFATWALWYFIGAPLVRSKLIPISALKCRILRLFGAYIGKNVYIKPGVSVKFPWHLSVGDHSWIGEDVWIDNLETVTVGSHVCVSQGAYFCTGNHDWKTRNMKLFRRPITLHDGCWLGARTIVCPGTVVGAGAVVAIGSVISRNVPDLEIWGGNPAIYLRDRNFY